MTFVVFQITHMSWAIGFWPDDSVETFGALDCWRFAAKSAVMALRSHPQILHLVNDIMCSAGSHIALNPRCRSVLVVVFGYMAVDGCLALFLRCVFSPETMATLSTCAHDSY